MSEITDKILVACPQCGNRFRAAKSAEGKQGRCPCGAQFTLCEMREEPVPARVAQPTAGPACKFHPAAAAQYACRVCHHLICRECDVPQANGSHLCRTCAVLHGDGTPGVRTSSVNPALVGVACAQHRGVPAVRRCRTCGKAVCATCDFTLPGNLHLCPECATAPPEFSDSRKTMAGIAIPLGLVTIAMMVLTIIMVSGGANIDKATDVMIELAGRALAVVGIGLAVGSYERRSVNPPLVWLAIAINTASFLLCFGLMFFGIFMMLK
jgi:hypothetical protein